MVHWWGRWWRWVAAKTEHDTCGEPQVCLPSRTCSGGGRIIESGEQKFRLKNTPRNSVGQLEIQATPAVSANAVSRGSGMQE